MSYTYFVRIDGETDTYYSREDLDDWLYELATCIVGDCEQEINDGGYFDDETGDERDVFIDRLYSDILDAVEMHLSGSTYRVEVKPDYAVQQGCTATFTVTERDDETDDEGDDDDGD